MRPLPTPTTVPGPVVDGVHVAAPVRVYADLASLGGRWAEAAQHLREVLELGTAA